MNESVVTINGPEPKLFPTRETIGRWVNEEIAYVRGIAPEFIDDPALVDFAQRTVIFDIVSSAVADDLSLNFVLQRVGGVLDEEEIARLYNDACILAVYDEELHRRGSKQGNYATRTQNEYDG